MRERNIRYCHSVAVQYKGVGNRRYRLYRYTRRFRASSDSAARANIGAYRERLNRAGRVTISELLSVERIRNGKLTQVRTVQIGVDDRQRSDRIG